MALMQNLRAVWWQMTLTLIEFQEGVHFWRRGGAGILENAPPFIANATLFSFTIYSLYFENDRSCAIRTAGNHCIFFFHPALHDRAALQTGVDITGNRVPRF